VWGGSSRKSPPSSFKDPTSAATTQLHPPNNFITPPSFLRRDTLEFDGGKVDLGGARHEDRSVFKPVLPLCLPMF